MTIYFAVLATILTVTVVAGFWNQRPRRIIEPQYGDLAADQAAELERLRTLRDAEQAANGELWSAVSAAKAGRMRNPGSFRSKEENALYSMFNDDEAVS